jgi:DNA-binding transcriptional regulator LsrR (DeoR family)
LFVRLEAVGLVNGHHYSLPITQVTLADIMGMSNVHVNRTLQALRQEGAVEWKVQSITIPDFERLQKLAQFDPAYLNLVKIPR